MISFDFNLLLGLYGPAPGATVFSPSTRRREPTPPWSPTSTAPQASDLVKAVMAGRRFIDPNIRIDAPGASVDYRKLFTAYQGLAALEALAVRADAKGITSAEIERISRRFTAGLDEVADYVEALQLNAMTLVRGKVSDKAATAAGVRRDKAEYVGAAIHRGDATGAVAAFSGDVRFSVDVTRLSTTLRIDFDLSEMGAATRSMSNVVSYLNSKLAAAGVDTRFVNERIAGQPKTINVGDRTVTLPAEPDRYALRVKSTTIETLSFSAPAAADAVYLTQTSGDETPAHQLLKFQTDLLTTADAPPAAVVRPDETHMAADRVFQADLGPSVGAVRATATGPDGSVFVLADIESGIGDQVLKGERDVALMRYDSAGRLMYSRTLGAAESATGFALAVAADGKVAIAGSVTGVLDEGEVGDDPNSADSFVTVFDADGDELWTQRLGAREDDEARSLAFGADGSVYVAGRTRSALPGETASGGWDAYVRGFTASGAATFTRQYGTGGEDRATALAVDGTAVVVGGVENGDLVARRFDLQPAGAPLDGAVRNLGAAAGGEITGLAIDGGRVLVVGSTGNAALDAGSTTTAHSGGVDAFVARLDAGLGADAGDRLTYFGGAGADRAAAATVSGGKLWLTGSSTDALPGLARIGAQDGFVARIDPETGAVEWSRRFAGVEGKAAPSGIAVGSGAASALDRLGLPIGALDWSDSKKIVAATSIRPGDQFFVRVGETGRPRAVTVAADDTLASLAAKLNRALGFRATAKVVSRSGFDRLEIVARDDRTPVFLTSGAAGRDALEALGLTEGLVRKPPRDPDDAKKAYGLNFTRDLSLTAKDDLKTALERIRSSMTAVRTAYRDLVDAGRPKSAAPPIPTGPAPEYLRNQLANYQAALARLRGG